MDENDQDKIRSKLMMLKDKRTLVRTQQETSSRWRWTGFTDKTLWDWLNLLGVLAIPFVVAVGTFILTQQQVQLSDAANKQQHQVDIQVATDQQRETILKTRMDDIKDLLLNKGLRVSQPKDEVRVIARAEVLAVLRQLDGERKGILMKFLSEAGLITRRGSDVVIDLHNADLEDANLINLDLNDYAPLDYAHLHGAQLDYAHLEYASLHGADLNGADLNGADLYDADLRGANLRGANLNGADLRGANLRGADLRGAIVTEVQLARVYTLQGAIMPDGSKHP